MRMLHGRWRHCSSLTSVELRTSSWNARSISAPKDSPITITLTSLLCRKLRVSRLVEPTVAQTTAIAG
eukprot:gene29379-33178_t